MTQARSRKIISCLLMVMLLAGVKAAAGKAPPQTTFTGKITEINKSTALGLGKREHYFIIKLDSQVNISFRLSPEDAVRYGLIEEAGPSQILTPKQTKALGWKVKLECEPPASGLYTLPVYRVKSLERMD
jgi:hypothetical protein